jgi:hypothetical protein
LDKLQDTVGKLIVAPEFTNSANDCAANDNRVSQRRYLPGLGRIRNPETNRDRQVCCSPNHRNMFTDCL